MTSKRFDIPEGQHKPPVQQSPPGDLTLILREMLLDLDRLNPGEIDEWVAPLFEHYKVDPASPGKWQFLAIHLALELIYHESRSPISQRAGHPTEWTIGRLVQLLDDADLAAKEIQNKEPRRKKVPKSLIAKKILKENPGKYSDIRKSKTLQNKLSEAKRRSVRLVQALAEGQVAEKERQRHTTKRGKIAEKNSQPVMFGMAELGRKSLLTRKLSR